MPIKDLRPYLLAAHIQWLDDSNEDPHIVIVNGPEVRFPPHLATADALTFKVSEEAVQNLIVDEAGVSFNARFNGKAFSIFAPFNSVVKLHSKNMLIALNLQQPPTNTIPTVAPPAPPPPIEQQPPAPVAKVKPKFGVIQGGKNTSTTGSKPSLSVV